MTSILVPQGIARRVLRPQGQKHQRSAHRLAAGHVVRFGLSLQDGVGNQVPCPLRGGIRHHLVVRRMPHSDRCCDGRQIESPRPLLQNGFAARAGAVVGQRVHQGQAPGAARILLGKRTPQRITPVPADIVGGRGAEVGEGVARGLLVHVDDFCVGQVPETAGDGHRGDAGVECGQCVGVGGTRGDAPDAVTIDVEFGEHRPHQVIPVCDTTHFHGTGQSVPWPRDGDQFDTLCTSGEAQIGADCRRPDQPVVHQHRETARCAEPLILQSRDRGHAVRPARSMSGRGTTLMRSRPLA